MVGGIPYGLPAGSIVLRGDAPDFSDEMSKLPVQTQTELRRAMELYRSGALVSAFEIFDGVVVLYPDLYQAVWGEVNTLFEMPNLSVPNVTALRC